MPTEENVTRKLRAILSADVKGYSLLMFDDEAFTVKTLKLYRKVMSYQIARHKGRVVDAVGDNLLAEFSSAVDAVRCSVEIQKDLQQKNADLPTDKRLAFRIGVNIGDVIQEGDRIYGNGVNVAARIEGLAASGGICISRNAYSHVRDKLELGYEYLGEHSVKNIKRPVRVYKVLMNSEDAGKLIGVKPKPVVKNWIWATIVVAAVIITSVVILVYQNVSKPEFEPAKVEEMAYPLPEKPSIAVLALDNMTGDPNLEYFSDGIAEEIITVLSMVNGLFVIARNSSFSYKGKPVKIQNVSEELGVRYVLEGSVRKSDGKVRVSAQLIDAVKGQHLWAESYDRDFNNILKLQDEISMKVVSSLQVNLTEGEQRRILSNYMNPEIFKKHVQAQSHMRKGTREGLERYGELATEIVALAPESRIGYRLLGWYHSGLYGLGENREQNLKKAFGFAQKTLSIDENDAFSLSLMCDLYLQMKEWDKSIASGQRSVELQPSSSQLHSVLGTSLCFAERYDEGITHCEKAIRLNPYPAYFDFLTLARCYFAKGRYEDAIIELKKSLKLSPNFAITHFWLAINYSLLNRDEEARMAAKKALEIAPIISISLAPKFWRFKTEDGLKVVIDAMRKAGFPEYPPGKG